jgi:hypothetical protein
MVLEISSEEADIIKYYWVEVKKDLSFCED